MKKRGGWFFQGGAGTLTAYYELDRSGYEQKGLTGWDGWGGGYGWCNAYGWGRKGAYIDRDEEYGTFFKMGTGKYKRGAGLKMGVLDPYEENTALYGNPTVHFPIYISLVTAPWLADSCWIETTWHVSLIDTVFTPMTAGALIYFWDLNEVGTFENGGISKKTLIKKDNKIISSCLVIKQ